MQDDFECDFGYERVGNSSCRRMTGISSNDCEQISSGNYYVSESHLRLIHNDSCVGVSNVVTDSDGHGTCVGPHCGSNNGKGRGALGKFFIFLLVSLHPLCLTCSSFLLLRTGLRCVLVCLKHASRLYRKPIPQVSAQSGCAVCGIVAWHMIDNLSFGVTRLCVCC